MKRVLSWVLGLPASIILIAFAVANRQWVAVSFDPLDPADPAHALNMPLWALAVAGMVLGLLIGWALAYVGQSRARRTVKRQRIEIDRLAADNDRLRAAIKSGAAAPAAAPADAAEAAVLIPPAP